jgi:hypothetical protein
MDTVDMAPRARQAADALVATLPTLVGPEAEKSESPRMAEVTRPELARLLTRELREMLAEHPDLAEAARRAGGEVHQNGAWSALREGLTRTLHDDHSRLDTLWSLLVAAGTIESAAAPPVAPEATEPAPADVRRSSSVLASLETGGALVILTGVVLLPMAVAGQNTEQDLLRWFAVVVMASLPGWLYLRFIVFRAGSLWTDYVLHLHRLGMDDHQHLPEPPLSSAYHRLWLEAGGPAVAGPGNIYQQKFEAYYGKAAGPRGATSGRLLRDRSMLTVLVATAIFAVGWATVLSGDAVVTGHLELPGDALRFGFMGAYSFSLQMLMRRFFQSDLKASAYIASSVRVISVLILVLVLVEAGLLGVSPAHACAAAFVIGFFPLVGMQLLQKAVAAGLRRWVPTLRNPYPLSDLDGLNVWYEARMLEEGIEDMQNLVTANIVDVLLHTKVPVGRLVDWMDQAHLYLLLDPSEDDGAKNRVHKDRLRLRRLGIRTATDLESAVTLPFRLARRADFGAVTRVKDRDDANIRALRAVLDGPPEGSEPVAPSAVDGILKTFCNMPNLVHVRHWRDVLGRDRSHR